MLFYSNLVFLQQLGTRPVNLHHFAISSGQPDIFLGSQIDCDYSLSQLIKKVLS